MSYSKKVSLLSNCITVFSFLLIVSALLYSCSSFTYITYIRNEQNEDPEPNYSETLDPEFQEYTNFMFIGNRIENFGTYFNTFYNAEDNYKQGYDEYEKRILSKYSERLDSILINPKLPPDAAENFNKAIEKASKVIQYHKSSAFMDKAVLLIGKSYFFLGDYLKAERKFNEFISKLGDSPLNEEAILYLARTQLRMKNIEPALVEIDRLIRNSRNSSIIAAAYQSLAEYYISQKDYESAIKDYYKSIELSSDNDFKAQMQFLIASLVARSNPVKGSAEFLKVLDYNVSYDLEYLSKYYNVKNAILGGDYTNVIPALDKLDIKYKDDKDYLPQIRYLRGLYYEQKKDYRRAIREYEDLIKTYSKTVSSADASYSVAQYYENILGDYLNAFRFYRFTTEESTGAHNYFKALERTKVYRKYFDLRSIIVGSIINTDYDSAFKKITQPKGTEEENKLKNEEKKGDQGKEEGKQGGVSMSFCSDSTKDDGTGPMESIIKKKLDRLDPLKKGNLIIPDSLMSKNPLDSAHKNAPGDSLKDNNISAIDSEKIKKDRILKAKFELSELFIYDLNRSDSAEYYLNEAYEGSDDTEFKSKVLFALSNLYRSESKSNKADETLNLLIKECPLTFLANEGRKLLNIPVIENKDYDEADSLYDIGQSRFARNEYPEALTVFQNIVADHPGSKYYLHSAYASGWIYENVLFKPDSAFDYYSRVFTTDPTSDFYKQVASKITFYKEEKSRLEDSLNPKPDSLKSDTSNIKLDTSNIKSPEKNEIKSEGENLNIMNGNDTGESKDSNGTNDHDQKKEGDVNLNPDVSK